MPSREDMYRWILDVSDYNISELQVMSDKELDRVCQLLGIY